MNFPGYPPNAWPRKLTQPSGKGTSGLLAFGEAPGGTEDEEGRPFVEWAEAGSVLQRVFDRAGVSRDALTLSNIVWYRPPENRLAGEPYEMDAIRACSDLNEALVER